MLQDPDVSKTSTIDIVDRPVCIGHPSVHRQLAITRFICDSRRLYAGNGSKQTVAQPIKLLRLRPLKVAVHNS